VTTRTTISSAQLYAILDSEWKKLRPRQCANCKIPLPSQQSLQAMWQIRVTCTRVDFFGTRFDAGFADDQVFAPVPS